MTAPISTGLAGDGSVFSVRRHEVALPDLSRPTAAKPRVVRPIDLQGQEIPPRRWLVPDWIPWGYVTGLYGDSGQGKSLLAQQLQTATAVGLPWVGLAAAETNSLGVYCEDSDEELWRRQHDINRLYGAEFSDLERATWMPRLGDDNLLVTFTSRGVAELTDFHRHVVDAARDLRCGLVIVDTVADTFGGNENDRSQVRQYVSGALGKIAKAIDGVVVACTHPSRTGLTSGNGDGGSTGWSAAFRSRMFLHGPEQDPGALTDPDARILTRKKANYAARSDTVAMHWKSGALVPDVAHRYGMRLSAEDVFLALLDIVNRDNRPVSDNPHAGNFAPRMFEQHPNRERYAKADFRRAMEALFARGVLKIEEYGRPSDLRRMIVRAEREG